MIKHKEKKHKRVRIKKNKNLTIAAINPNGIKGRLDSIESLLTAVNIHIALISETKLTKNQKINIKGYKWIGKSRKHKEGGGVGILLSNEIAKHAKEDNSSDEEENLEALWITLECRPRNISIAVFYGPQENEKHEKVKEIYEKFENQIKQKSKNNEIIIGGDFNAKLAFDIDNTQQKESRNGKILQELTDRNNLEPITLNAEKGIWTRHEWNNKEKKSTVDYILTSRTIAKNVSHTIVDEEGSFRVKGKNDKGSDHNTLLTNIKVNNPRTKTSTEKWNVNNKPGWKEFNTRMKKVNQIQPFNKMDYTEVEQKILEMMRGTVGKMKIRTHKTRTPKNKEITENKKKRKETRKIFEKACREGNSKEKKEALEEYIAAQQTTRTAREEYEAKEAEKRINYLIEKTTIEPNTIWQARKRAKNSNEYDTITEDGTQLTNPDQTKAYIAHYFENLYQARLGTKEYEDTTKHIKETMENLKQQYHSQKTEDKPISEKELKDTIKRLKWRKSLGPDEIPNELFIEADSETRRTLLHIINKVHKSENIPISWLEGEIKRLYKGKGTKGKCSNERGITLASNVGKVYERILNERTKKEVQITKAQGGGIAGNATVDHLIVLNEAIRQIRQKGKTAYVIFLDVQKAYDKAWLDAILYVMHKNGISAKNLEMMRKTNSDLRARIRTKYGLTRKIKIKDSIRQGGVLSVIEYATLMDEITKELQEKKQGLTMKNGTTLHDLLWMDDVALIHEDPKMLQLMMDTTNHVAMKYHVEFGAPKCKVVRCGPGRKPKIELNGQVLEKVKAYKYLGVMINNKDYLEDQISNLKGKITACTQEILAETGNKEFNGKRMRAIWELIETTIIPIITYGSESWEPTKGEMEQIETIFNKALKTILHLPQQTPTAILLAETGFHSIELYINRRKIMHASRILKMEKDRLIQTTTNNDSLWIESIEQLKEKYSITNEQMIGDNEPLKKIIETKNREKFQQYIEREAAQKSKVKHWLEMKKGIIPSKREAYMSKLTRKQCSSIVKVRTRMLQVKVNHAASHSNKTCRLCKESVETQKHILTECPVTKDEINSIPYEKYFTETDREKMEKITNDIEKTVEILNSYQGNR